MWACKGFCRVTDREKVACQRAAVHVARDDLTDEAQLLEPLLGDVSSEVMESGMMMSFCCFAGNHPLGGLSV